VTDKALEPLIDTYHSMMAEQWTGSADEIPKGLIRKADGTLIFIALALEPDEAYVAMLQMVIVEEAEEAVFALDRFAKPGQGTKYADVLAGHYFKRDLGAHPWRPFVIEYQTEPRTFEPVDYNNTFWNAALSTELRKTMLSIVKKLVPESVH
jgi:hypothetical protein